MICKLFECENNATPPYQFCSGTHAYNFKNRQAEMDSWFSANEAIKQTVWYHQTKLEANRPYRDLYSVEEVIELAK